MIFKNFLVTCREQFSIFQGPVDICLSVEDFKSENFLSTSTQIYFFKFSKSFSSIKL